MLIVLLTVLAQEIFLLFIFVELLNLDAGLRTGSSNRFEGLTLLLLGIKNPESALIELF